MQKAKKEVLNIDKLESIKIHLQSRGLSERTIYSYHLALNKFYNWLVSTGGDRDASVVTALDIAEYKRYLQKQQRKPSTINQTLDILNIYFTFLTTEGVISINSAAGVKKVAQQKNAPKWLHKKDLGALMRAVQKYGTIRDQSIILLMLHAGLRVSEVCNLRKNDIVLRERSGMVIVRQGKGDKFREVPLNVTVRKGLEQYTLAITEPGEWLFPGRKGPMTSRTAERVLEKFSGIAGIEVTPHQLRHTFCKMLLDADEPLDRVAALAGHENLNTTARYTRPSNFDLEEAVEKLAWE